MHYSNLLEDLVMKGSRRDWSRNEPPLILDSSENSYWLLPISPSDAVECMTISLYIMLL
jgi:hypothetical protein